MKTMSTKELRLRLDSGTVALFDVRGDVEYEQGHIPGAKTAPLGSLSFRVSGVIKPDSLVVIYSDSVDDPLNDQNKKPASYSGGRESGKLAWPSRGRDLLTKKTPHHGNIISELLQWRGFAGMGQFLLFGLQSADDDPFVGQEPLWRDYDTIIAFTLDNTEQLDAVACRILGVIWKKSDTKRLCTNSRGQIPTATNPLNEKSDTDETPPKTSPF